VREVYFLPKYVPQFQFAEDVKLEGLMVQNKLQNEISVTQEGNYEDACLLSCSAMQRDRSIPTFQRCSLPPS
jgi:hypothetical protein